jgi:hypothetical protein
MSIMDESDIYAKLLKLEKLSSELFYCADCLIHDIVNKSQDYEFSFNRLRRAVDNYEYHWHTIEPFETLKEIIEKAKG